MSLNQVQEALLLFKKSLLPTDNIDIRNAYIKMRDHGSQAIVILVGNLRAETLQEKMTLRSSETSLPTIGAEGPLFRNGRADNAVVQRKIFQLLSIMEPLLLNDESVIKALNAGLTETLSEMLIFQG